jgi:hypothetical protein
VSEGTFEEFNWISGDISGGCLGYYLHITRLHESVGTSQEVTQLVVTFNVTWVYVFTKSQEVT